MNSPESGLASDDFYSAAVKLLQTAEIPFLVGGAYALRHYTGVIRDTKDFDVFLRREDLDRTLELFRAAGYRADLTFSHWLAKVHYDEFFIDLIFRAGNGLCAVDDAWFGSGEETEMMGAKVGVVRAEDMIWQKAYIMERERFDGADIMHLIRERGDRLDWESLLKRFGPHWRVLLAHLVVFGFVYPAERDRIPSSVMHKLHVLLGAELGSGGSEEGLCRGTLISRAQYLPDIQQWGYKDARLEEGGEITETQIAAWTDAIGKERAWA